MAKLIKIKNPFEPWVDREVIELEPGVTLEQVVSENRLPVKEVNITVNASSMPLATVVKDNDFVVLSPAVMGGDDGVKQIFSVVAMVALSAVTFGTGGLVAGWGNTLLANIAGAAVMFVGSVLINRVFGTRADIGSYGSYDTQATYNWDGVQTMEGQNNAISLTYGSVKSGGQSISKYVDVKNNDEYLNWLVAAGEGPLAFSDIRLNDTEIGFFSNVTYETREGTNTQDIIANFNDTYATKTFDYELTETERIEQVQGNAVQGIKIKVECPRGLYYANDSGGLDNAWVSIEAQYRKGTDGSWHTFAISTISDNVSSTVRKEFRVDNLGAGSYYVKLKVTGRSHSTTNSRAGVRIDWTELTGIVYDDFAYPNIALIGIKAKATDQLSGAPSLTFIKTRAKVWVYNPYTLRYEQRNADNPAWASYDMLHQCAKLQNPATDKWEFDVRGVPAKYMVYDQFDEWATFCEDKNLKVNIEINTLGEMLEVVNSNIAAVGRGRIVRFGTRYGCVWDCVKAPVQMFGMGNIIAGSFKENFLQTTDRANCIEITYTDANHDYNRETITIFGADYDNAVEERTAQATFNGITSYEQAYREGMYQLYSNKHLLRTVSFEANIDAIACTVGDVVLVSHDVPKWAKSGRIHEVDGQVVTLPVELDNTTDRYRIMYRTVNDNIYTSNVEVLENGDGWCKLNVLSAFNATDKPQKNDVFDVAIANIGSKPFVVKNITRAQDFTRKIECLEYNENIYNEQYDIPPVQYSTATNKPVDVHTVRAIKYRYLTASGETMYKLDVSWIKSSIGQHIIYISDDGVSYELLETGINGSSYTASISSSARYVKIVTTNGAISTDGVVAGIDVLDTELSSLKVTDLKAESKYREYADGTSGYDVLVTYSLPVAAETVEVFYKTDGMAADDVGTFAEGVVADEAGYSKAWKQAGEGISGVTISQATLGDTYMIKARGRSASGLYSDFTDIVYCTVEPKGTVPSQPYGLQYDFSNSFRFTWNDIADSDAVYYELRSNANVGASDGLLSRTRENFCEVSSLSRTGKVYLYAVNSQKIASYPSDVSWDIDKPVAPKLSFAKTPRGMAVTVTNKTADIKAIVYHATCSQLGFDETITSQNTVYTYTGEAGIYAVSAHFVDIFGAGAESDPYSVVIDATFDEEWIEDGSITADKLNDTVNSALQDAVDSVEAIESVRQEAAKALSSAQEELNQSISDVNDSITEVVTVLGKDPDAAGQYKAISKIKQTADEIVQTLGKAPDAKGQYSAISSLKATADSIIFTVSSHSNNISAMQSSIKQTSDSITAVVTNLNDSTKANDYAAISAITQSIDGIKTTVSGENGLTSQIKQANDNITAIVTNLNDADKAKSYAAISAMSDAIGLKVSKDDVINQINLTPEGTTIDGKYLHITGKTLFDDDVIVEGMIQAGAVTADKLSANTITLINNQGFQGGAIKLDSSGLTCKSTNGDSVLFNSYGMNFVDSSGNTYARNGRIVLGAAADGQHITFSVPWKTAPTVICSPNSLPCNLAGSGYETASLSIICKAKNVTANGFDVDCKTVVSDGRGSGACSIDTTASNSCIVKSRSFSANAYSMTIDFNGGKIGGDDGWNSGGYTVGTNVKVYINDSLYKSFSCSNSYRPPSNPWSSGTSTRNGDSSPQVIDVNVAQNDEISISVECSSDTKSYYSAANISYTYTAVEPVAIATGTAMFIAIEKNSDSYSVK